MSYQVIARKWRPKLFEDLIGQDHVAKTLSNSIQSARVAHGYLFAGPRGVGKTSTARIFAKALNCPNPNNGHPCNTCSTCIEITNGNGIDVIEIDGASNNSVDNIRDLRENIRFTPTGGRYKIYIIDEVHMLSKGAFNALLKTLEEPPKHAVFIFATTEIHKVLPTILSRCQRFDFKRIPITAIVDTLEKICKAESIQIDQNGLIQIAKKADGSMRDAQSVLDQLISFCGNQITTNDIQSVLGIISQDLFFKITNSFIQKDTAESFLIIERLFQDGFDLTEVIHGLEEHLRHLLVCISMQSAELVDVALDYKNQFQEQAESFNQIDILRIIEILQKTEPLIRSGSHPRIRLELAFAKICQMDKSIEISELLNSINGEKKKPEINIRKRSTNSDAQIPNQQLQKEVASSEQSIVSNPAVDTEQIINTPAEVENINIISDQKKTISEPESSLPEKTIAEQIPNKENHDRLSDYMKPKDLISEPILNANSIEQNHLVTPINRSINDSHGRIDRESGSSKSTENTSSDMIEEYTESEIKAGKIKESKIINTNADHNSLAKMQSLWSEIVSELKIKKPTLAACLSQSFLKEIANNKLNIIFDDTAAGKFNLNTFRMNIDFIKLYISDKTSIPYKIETSLENFDQSGVEVESKDLETVVKRLRQKDELMDSAMNTFALEAVEFGRKK